ncbi:MAG: cytochrome b/b6 domain-containing protein [Pseudomonadota bacterium]|nr:cytochrome b/b6 domain-containing protein [Pseudomonadota bacterium]
MTSSSPGYTATQIFLHWAIAALILFQLVFGENIENAWRAYRRGLEPSADATFNANVHVVVGITVLVLAAWRVALRLRRGAPPLPADDSALQRMVARVTHGALYLAILLVPVSGAVAWFGGVAAAAEAHELAKPAIIVLLVLHIAGALFQHFIAKSDVMRRMVRPAGH